MYISIPLKINNLEALVVYAGINSGSDGLLHRIELRGPDGRSANSDVTTTLLSTHISESAIKNDSDLFTELQKAVDYFTKELTVIKNADRDTSQAIAVALVNNLKVVDGKFVFV